jgi:hypothetical protein
MERRHNFQNVAWFNDLRQRNLLDLDPPYQRRSVWPQRFKDYFIETVLLNYPAPAIFLFEEMSPEGRPVYHVVDGRQRLTTLFEFVDGRFPIGERFATESLRGTNFHTLNDEHKRKVWTYQFLVEYVPKDDEDLIEGIFDRINRNVAKLTPQELRHAKYDGAFIQVAERLALWMKAMLPQDFPRLASQSRSQMKDVELAALLLLLTEKGPGSYSQAQLDIEFAARDDDWSGSEEIEIEFRQTVETIKAILDAAVPDFELKNSKLRNQADFYSLFGAIHQLKGESSLPVARDCGLQLGRFLAVLDDAPPSQRHEDITSYYEAARSASSDKGPREERIRIIKRVLLKQLPL